MINRLWTPKPFLGQQATVRPGFCPPVFHLYPSGKRHLFMPARGLWPRGARRRRLASEHRIPLQRIPSPHSQAQEFLLRPVASTGGPRRSYADRDRRSIMDTMAGRGNPVPIARWLLCYSESGAFWYAAQLSTGCRGYFA